MKLILLMLQIILLFFTLTNQSFADSAYNQKLPANIDSDPDLCNLIDCKSVIPEATIFSKRKGNPAYVEAYIKREGNQELIGYVFLSTDIDDTVGYSGKPIVTLMAINTNGKIIGIKVLKHSEPILLAGIPENDFIKFLDQYIGHFANTNFEIGKGKSVEGNIDLVSGATVTVIAQNQLISRSVYAVARQVGLVKEVERPQAILIDSDKILSWDDLIKKNAISHILVTSSNLGIEDDNRDFIDLYYGYLNAPEVGKSVLGERI